MTFALLPALAAYIPRDRVDNILRPGSPLPEEGVALIADISGFTPLTEALTTGLSPDQGAEELTHALSGVFTPLIAEINAYYGSVIKFGGDALIVWYPRERGVRRAAVIRRAITSAWRMQQAIKIHGQVPTPIGIITLKMKIGLTYGPVKRFNLGLPEYGYEDVLGGATLDRMAEAEHHANSGDIMLDAATLAAVTGSVTIAEWRDNFASIGHLLSPARPKPWPPLTWPPEEETPLVERLAAYVPQQIYQTLAAGRVQVAELKPVVSLFVQFHGIDYDADPQVGVKLQSYFSTAQVVAARYGGRVNRLITGDKGSLIHVIFGAPRTVEEQEARAIRCALDLQAECGGLSFIAMQRIGVTSGRVFAGPIGSPNRRDYTTMGDSINLSARLMQNAADHQILLEKAVRDPLGPEFELADLGTIMVKGKSQPIPVFAAIGVQTLLERPARKETFAAGPIFGRDQELAHLRQQLAQLGTERGKVILLTGDVGMGKTLLIDVLRAEVFEAGQSGWADGICLAYGQTFSGYLFTDLLRDLLELPPGAGPAETSQYLRYFCQNLFDPARLDATYPYLARFLDLPLTGESAQRLEGLSGESIRWQLFELFPELFRRLLERGPWVLALDDLQWADPTSLQLVEALLPLVAGQPLILLLAMRPERDRKAWSLRQQILAQMPEQAVDLTMGSLEQTAATALITHFAPELPEAVITYLLDKSGGNPLFLVEIMHTLAAQGWLAPDVDLSGVALDSLNLPDSVQGLLLAQIDRLAVEARHTLQMASVIGKNFLYRVLEAIAAGEAALDQQLATLETQEHIQKESEMEQDTAYTFRHVLIQESAYSTLLYERRRVYHRQVAEALERLFPWHSGEQVGLLAFHYERADDLEQAITYYLHAADQARLLYANEEAEALYQKVLHLLDRLEAEGVKANLERRAKTCLKLAQVRANTLDFEGAQEFYNQAFDLLGQLPSSEVNVSEGEHIFRLNVFEPETLDPGLGETTGSVEITKNLFEGLVELDTELNIIPAVARRWRVEEEGKLYRFELRPNLKWSDGSPLTAHDFIFAWRRNLHPETNAGAASQLYVVQGAEEFHQGKNADPDSIAIKALDDLNLEITLNVSASYFLYLLADPITYPQPAHIVPAKDAAWSQPENLVCNGPFKAVAWLPGQEIRLEKNPFYHSLAGNVKKVLLTMATPGLEQYINDQIDWCPVQDQANLPARYPDETLLVQYLTTYFLAFSCDHLPFSQRLVRQAFAKSINQKELVHEVWFDAQKPALGGVVPPGMPGHSPEIGLDFDPAAARDLLRQAGFKNGAELPRLSLAVLSGFSTTPDYLQASWREHLGVQVELIRDMSHEEMVANLRQGSAQLAITGWGVDYPDPDDILRIQFHGDSQANFLGWRSQQFDQWVEQAASLTGQQARLALYHQADRLLVAEDTAVVPLYYLQEYGLLRPGFRLEGAGQIIQGGTFRFKNIRVI